jgi:23S rRNA (uracil1939-C5)-methyltransferase
MTRSVCRHFSDGRCTGCTALDTPYSTQLSHKTEGVRLVFTQAGLDARLVMPTIPSPSPLHYRASVKLCLNEDRDGRRAIGLYRGGSHQVVSTFGCPAQMDVVNQLIATLFPARGRLPAKLYDHRGRVFQRGRLKFLLVRASPDAHKSGHGAGIVISHTGAELAPLKAWIHAAGLRDLCVYESRLTAGDKDAQTGREIRHLAGPKTFSYPLAGHVHQLSPASFFQANALLAESLVAAAVDFSSPGDTLLDLYGGFGAYSAAASPRFKRLLVVDGNSTAIAALNDSGASWAKAATGYAGRCEEYLAEKLSAADAARVTHVIVNPPRDGLSRQVVTRLAGPQLAAARELHYVSCNPDSLVRDLRALVASGWRLRDARPFDMFPQTPHVETVARLMR